MSFSVGDALITGRINFMDLFAIIRLIYEVIETCPIGYCLINSSTSLKFFSSISTFCFVDIRV